MAREGVIKFAADHRRAPLDPALAPVLAALIGWRQRLWAAGLVGQDPGRYDGAGYGNVSTRVDDAGHVRAQGSPPPFLVSGTQTGGLAEVTAADFCLVTACDLAGNRVTSVGQTPPSSESMTHAAVYAAAPVRHVLHVHSPDIWQCREALGLPSTPAEVAYGTPAMAAAVAAAARGGVDLLCMAGHEDGVITFGDDGDALVVRLLALLERARE